jgi:hypothetical protein
VIVWNGERASSLLEELGFPCHFRKSKSANFSIAGPQFREISISLTRKNGVTAYVNRYSTTGQAFPVGGFDGVDVIKLYPLGHNGLNGNPGIAGSVYRHNPSLNPKKNDVLLLHVHSEKTFSQLLAWYGS